MTDGLRAQIATRGGLCSVTDLADRWGMTRQGAALVTAARGSRIRSTTAVNGRRLWFADEADGYRADHIWRDARFLGE